jgi:hypothetical protein
VTWLVSPEPSGHALPHRVGEHGRGHRARSRRQPPGCRARDACSSRRTRRLPPPQTGTRRLSPYQARPAFSGVILAPRGQELADLAPGFHCAGVRPPAAMGGPASTWNNRAGHAPRSVASWCQRGGHACEQLSCTAPATSASRTSPTRPSSTRPMRSSASSAPASAAATCGRTTTCPRARPGRAWATKR